MKKLLYSLFVLAALVMLFASCGTQSSTLSITKRHYNKGYFVEINTKHKAETISKSIKTSVTETTSITQVAASNKVLETTPIIVTNTNSAIASSKNKEDISNELNVTASAIKNSAPGNLKHTITPNTLKELKNMRAISKSIVSENKGNNNNNSLIWTIIIILLLLWLLSFLMGGWGLGGLLNLLLVIAVILIILKLLGVI